MIGRRNRRQFTEKFKNQKVQLYNGGKLKSEIVQEYDLTLSALSCWIQRINVTGLSKEVDNRTIGQEELLKLRKHNNYGWEMTF